MIATVYGAVGAGVGAAEGVYKAASSLVRSSVENAQQRLPISKRASVQSKSESAGSPNRTTVDGTKPTEATKPAPPPEQTKPVEPTTVDEHKEELKANGKVDDPIVTARAMEDAKEEPVQSQEAPVNGTANGGEYPKKSKKKAAHAQGQAGPAHIQAHA